MRLKVYTADSFGEAMRQVRRELGDEAIIVSSHEADGRAQLTAALDREPEPDLESDDDPALPETGAERGAAHGIIRGALVYHGVPDDLANRLADLADGLGTDEPTLALSAAIDQLFTFRPLSDRQSVRPLFLVGPPGSGKTTTASKIAMRARLAAEPATVITLDTMRPAAYEQLESVTSILGAELAVAESEAALRKLLDGCETGTRIVVDTAGTSPYDEEGVARLGRLVATARAEPVLVLPAGMDALEAAEVARGFSDLAPSRLVVTRIDITRRLGSVLAAAQAAELPFGDAGASSRVVDPLSPLNPVALARLLMRDPLRVGDDPPMEKGGEV